jgi:acyl-CoA dehydrogenase
MSELVTNGRVPAIPDAVVAAATSIGRDIAGPAAAAVDEGSLFPQEAIDALRKSGLLGALVPVDLGGLGQSIEVVARTVTELGRHCSSAAMVYAMHQIQVACLVAHGHTDHLRDFTRRVAAEGLLLASATSEVGIGGDVRSSGCCIMTDGDSFSLTKQAPVISYGEYADAILATARRTQESPASDQVLAVCPRDDLTLDPTSGWDALGFRGTCSMGFVLSVTSDRRNVLPDPYGDISSQTMLPVSHILWSSLWLGIASAAADRARAFVQAAARRTPGSPPPSALRLAELTVVLQQLQDLVHGARRRYEESSIDDSSSIGFAIGMNTLKVGASTLVVEVVQRALLICGMAGYANRSPYSLGRLLRDAYGAQLMVNNDRINANNSQLLLIHREHQA